MRTRFPLPLVLLFTAAAGVASLHAKPGDVDHGFGKDGHVFLHFDKPAYAHTMDVQKDGKIVIGGELGGYPTRYSSLLLARFLPDGSLDKTFGKGGLVTPSYLENWGGTRSLAIDGKGRIVCIIVGGIARFLPDGSLDLSFDADGYMHFPNTGPTLNPEKVLLADDGGIIVIGERDKQQTGSRPFIVRLHEDGSRDPRFGKHGLVEGFYRLYSSRPSAAVLPGGRILLLDNISRPGEPGELRGYCYRRDGSPDPDYGTGGTTENLSTTEYTVSSNVAIPLPGGGVAFAGGAFNFETEVGGLMAGKLTADGRLAPYFRDRAGLQPPPQRGIAIASPFDRSESPTSIVLDPQGRLIIAGLKWHPRDDDAPLPRWIEGFTGMLTRFNADGSEDKTFGRDGSVIAPHGRGESMDQAVALQADGKILVAGHILRKRETYIAITRLKGGGPARPVR